MELEASTGAIRLAPPIRSNVNLEAKVGVSVTDGKNEARSNFQVKGTHGFLKRRGGGGKVKRAWPPSLPCRGV